MTMLNSPFHVRLYNMTEDDEGLYFYQEAVIGGDFFDLLKRMHELPESPHGTFYTACVVSALEHMHSKKIVYRDLKPENLLIDKKGYLKLCDYGFAKIIYDKSYSIV